MSFLGAFRFSMQLLICELFFFTRLKRRDGLAWRIPLGFLTYVSGAYLCHLLRELVWSDSHPAFNHLYSMLMYFGIFAASIAMMAIIFRAQIWGYLSVAVGGYAAEHIGFCLYEIVRPYWGSLVPFDSLLYYLLFRILPYVLVGTVVYFSVIRQSPHLTDTSTDRPRRVMLSAIILLACLVLSVLVSVLPEEAFLICRIYGMISCSLGLYILFLYSEKERLEWEKAEIDRLLYVSQEQDAMSAEAVEIINMKCHDLKHQMARLQRQVSGEEEREFIGEITNAINIYDSSVKTGNTALDIVLMQKMLICDNHHIPFDFFGSGERLGFISSADISSIFGNALDNAIESQLKEDESRRFINLKIRMAGDIILIHVDNYCSHQPVFVNGLPQTSKSNTAYSGFGTKSIQYIAKKYGGRVKIQVKEETYNLDIMLPIPTANES